MALAAGGCHAMAAAGALMVAFGVGTGGAGPALMAIGSIGATAFNATGEYLEQREIDGRIHEILQGPGIGLDDETAARFMQLPPDHMTRLAAAYGLDPASLPALLQEEGLVPLLFNPLPPEGIAGEQRNPYLQLMNQRFRGPDGAFDGAGYLAFVRGQAAAAEAAGAPGAKDTSFIAALMGEYDRFYQPGPTTAAEWEAAFGRHEAYLNDPGYHEGEEARALALANLAYLREVVAGP
jgi:hypothetical protein